MGDMNERCCEKIGMENRNTGSEKIQKKGESEGVSETKWKVKIQENTTVHCSLRQNSKFVESK